MLFNGLEYLPAMIAIQLITCQSVRNEQRFDRFWAVEILSKKQQSALEVDLP